MTAKQTIQEMVNRIVRQFDPEKVILFGSQARGDARPDSDVDLLIVLRKFEGTHRQKRLEIRSILHGMGIGKDIVVRTQEELDGESKVVGTIGRAVSREGLVLYERPH